MRLIINADDLGYSKGVNCGIADAHRNGIVTSATAMANMPAFGHAMDLVREHPALGIGLHFNITSGRPLSKRCSTLTKADGAFRGADFIFSSAQDIDPLDVEKELCAQMQALLNSGCRPTHIDSHHHVHAVPSIKKAVLGYAQEMGIPVRSALETRGAGIPLRKAATLCTDFHAENADTQWLISYLENCGEELVELMTHPGFVDEPLLVHSTYSLARAKEHAVLTSGEVKAFIAGRGIKLVRYDQI